MLLPHRFVCMLSQTDRDRLEGIQRSAMRTIFYNQEYQDRLSLLHFPTLCDFIFSLGERLFSRIVFFSVIMYISPDFDADC